MFYRFKKTRLNWRCISPTVSNSNNGRNNNIVLTFRTHCYTQIFFFIQTAGHDHVLAKQMYKFQTINKLKLSTSLQYISFINHSQKLGLSLIIRNMADLLTEEQHQLSELASQLEELRLFRQLESTSVPSSEFPQWSYMKNGFCQGKFPRPQYPS